MARNRIRLATFALALLGLGIVTVVVGDFALQWQPVPEWLPARRVVAYVSGMLLFFTGAGLLWARTEATASRVFYLYSLVWLALKVPALLAHPLVEGNWLGAGELAVIAAAGLVLVASTSRQRTIARYAFAVALIPIGLSHFFYPRETLAFVPLWLPFRPFWAALGGAGHLAAGLGVLFGVRALLAARLEAAMIGAFTLLVWLPGIISTPTSRLQWTAFLMSWIIAAAAWVVAESMVRQPSAGANDAPVNAPGHGARETRAPSRV